MKSIINNNYNPSKIEPFWQKRWAEAGLYRAVDLDHKPKKYLLIEFPYPSGERLHVGHGRSYCALDALARKWRMEGKNVLYPIGWDAFGLPAENYAIKTRINPALTTSENIKNAKKQAKSWGLSFDWSREINTTDPNYYQWTQWIFLKMLEHGLAYRDEVAVNWCPVCKTNLADEEVLADGTHERCGKPTEKRKQKQWLLRITKYADRLLEDLKTVDYLPKILIQQENWIGKKEGVEIRFWTSQNDENIRVFTTRPETIEGATFVVLSPNHPLAGKIKTVINPATGKEIPVFVDEYVLDSVGTGAIMGVPSYDERDMVFAKEHHLAIAKAAFTDKNYGKKTTIYHLRDWVFSRQHYWGEPIPVIYCRKCLENSKLETRNSKQIQNSNDQNSKQKSFENSDLENSDIVPPQRDPALAVISDFGFCASNLTTQIKGVDYAVIPVPYDQLPVKLPYVERYEPTGTGESPLAGVKDWVQTICPKCGGPAKRETDTMPNWAGSNWYYVAYLLASKLRNPEHSENSENQNVRKSDDRKVRVLSGRSDSSDSLKIRPSEYSEFSEKNDIFSRNLDILKYWLPVDLYNGGMEHTTLHLLYSRFVYKFLFDLGVVPTSEPYQRRHSHGTVLGADGQKMSKSRGSVINPDEIIKTVGADTFRLYEMFMGPFEQTVSWSEEGMMGCHRFLKRVWILSQTKSKDFKTPQSLQIALQKTVKKVGEDLEALKFNTAIASMMEFINLWARPGMFMNKKDVATFLQILAPFAPHLTEELWEKLKNKELSSRLRNFSFGIKPFAKGKIIRSKKLTKDSSEKFVGSLQFSSIHASSWPKYSAEAILEKEAVMIVEVNGKVRDKLEVRSEKLEAGKRKWEVRSEIEKLARESGKVQKYLAGKKVKHVIFVPGKLINFVVA